MTTRRKRIMPGAPARLLAWMLPLVLVAVHPPVATSAESPPYLDPTLSPEERALDLLPRMTLDEKIGQMTQVAWTYLADVSDIATYHLGSLLGGEDAYPNTPLNWAERYNECQTTAVENTRLGIPLIWGTDAVHGHGLLLGAVVFPHRAGMGSTWNPALVEESAHTTALEVAATGRRWNFAPVLDVARNDRWGRTYEAFGEDPHLAGVLGAHEVNGYQGADLAAPDTIAACGKHYMGSGGTTDGEDQGNCVAPLEIIREVHLDPFIFAVQAGVQTVMASFCSVNGEKVHGSSDLLTGILKQEQGFGNFIVSDWAGIDQVDPDYATAVERSVNAGIDMSMVPDDYATFRQTMRDLIAAGRIAESRVDGAVYRILVDKFRLGLFESPYADAPATWVVGSTAHRDVARRAVRESVVLLKNDGILPLSRDASIFVAGPNADNMVNQCGGWTAGWQRAPKETPPPGTTILGAIRDAATATVTFSEDGTGAAGHDVAIVVVGEEPYAEYEGDVANLDLPQGQLGIIDTVVGSGTPTVVVLVAGRPRTGIESRLPGWRAFLMAWLPGTEGGGVADVLFGDCDATGRLSRSWPRTTVQEPINYDRRPGEPYDPLFPFGYGLSYTTFAYSNLVVTPSGNVGIGDTLAVSVDVTNTGARSGGETVQVYVTDVEASVAVPVKKLYRFAKIALDPGEVRTVAFSIPVEELGYYTGGLERTVEEGILNLAVGPLVASIEVTSGGTQAPAVQTFTPASWPPVPPPPGSVPPGTGTGLRAEYYTSTRKNPFNELRSVVIDPAINFDPFTDKLAQETGQSRSCAVRWMGWVEARHSESYTFYARTDDGVRVWLDGRLLVDRWVNQQATEFYNSVSLTAGARYEIKVEYYQGRLAAVAQLFWGSLSTPKEIVPTAQLYPVEPDTTPPSAPTGLAATAVSSSRIDLGWTENTEEDLAGYRVYRDTSSGVTADPGHLVAETTTNSYSDTGLSPSTTYYYVVTAFDTSGNESSESNEASATTQEGGGAVMHVGSIDVTLTTRGPFTNGVATVTVVDEAGAPVEGATVYGHWTGATSDSDSGATDVNGEVSLKSDKVSRPPSGTTFTFVVDNVTKAGWTYDPAANVETSDSAVVP